MRQVEEEFERREVVFKFSHPSVSTNWGTDFEPMIFEAMREFMNARSTYAANVNHYRNHVFDGKVDPNVSFTASNGVSVELDWEGRRQIRYPLLHTDEAIDSLLAGTSPAEHDDLLRIVEAEEREIANAKPNPRKEA